MHGNASGQITRAPKAEAAGAGISLTDVQNIVKEASEIFRLDTDEGEYYAKAIIHAFGAQPKTPGFTRRSSAYRSWYQLLRILQQQLFQGTGCYRSRWRKLCF